MDIKKITSVGEIYKDGELLSDYFECIDASGIDLSEIPVVTNPDLYFANLHNTGLKFILDQNCSSIQSADLRGTHMTINTKTLYSYPIHFNNVIFDSNQIAYLNKLYNEDLPIPCAYWCDYDTMINNPGLKLYFANVKEIIKEKINENKNNLFPVGYSKDLDKIVNLIDSIIEKSNNKEIKLIYDNIKEQMKSFERIYMFSRNRISYKKIHDITINQKIYKCLNSFDLIRCELDNVIFDISIEQFTNYNISFEFGINNVNNVKFPNIGLKLNSTDDIDTKRIGKTPFTFRCNYYVELGRKCNASCSFCRNRCMQTENYDVDNIVNTLRLIGDNIDDIFIGGGEPTLKINDVLKVIEYKSRRSYDNITLITNGNKLLEDLYYFDSPCRDINYMISRHSYNDEENAKIFGISASDIIPIDKLPLGMNNRLTLACTCFKGGMDSPKKIIEYIRFAYENDISDILFTNLQDDASVSFENKNDISNNIDSNLFRDVIDILIENGWKKEKYPIISNSGYELVTLNAPEYNFIHMTVRFKRYVSKKELEILWLKAVKRTFDLSISPNGKLYDDWSETNAKVYIK